MPRDDGRKRLPLRGILLPVANTVQPMVLKLARPNRQQYNPSPAGWRKNAWPDGIAVPGLCP
jgi:hypothetical protein